MSDPKVVLLKSSLEEILKKGGIPLEDLPLSAAEKAKLRAEADQIRLNPGGWRPISGVNVALGRSRSL
jgi:hypothetical protein